MTMNGNEKRNEMNTQESVTSYHMTAISSNTGGVKMVLFVLDHASIAAAN